MSHTLEGVQAWTTERIAMFAIPQGYEVQENPEQAMSWSLYLNNRFVGSYKTREDAWKDVAGYHGLLTEN